MLPRHAGVVRGKCKDLPRGEGLLENTHSRRTSPLRLTVGTSQRHTPCSRCCSFSSTKASSWLRVGNRFCALHIMSITIELRRELGERAIVEVASSRQGQAGTYPIQFRLTFNSGIKERCINLCLVTPILRKVKLRYVEGLSSW